MLVVCAGMVRSGSTLQFNITKEIIQLSGGGYIHGNENIAARSKEAQDTWRVIANKTHVCKPHLYHNKLNVRVNMTYRDLRDVVVSTMRFRRRSFDDVLSKLRKETIDREAVWLSEFAPAQIRRVRYEDMWVDLKKEAEETAAFLSVDLTEQQLESIARRNHIQATRDRIRSMNNMNAHTRYGPRHINTGKPGQYLKELTDRQVLAIEDEVGEWLVANGYELEWETLE